MAFKAPQTLTDGHFIFRVDGTQVEPFTPVAPPTGQEEASEDKSKDGSYCDWWEGQEDHPLMDTTVFKMDKGRLM